MPRFDDASVLHSDGSKNVRTSGKPREFINLVQDQSFGVMWTKTHVWKLKVKTLVDSGFSKTIFTDCSLLSNYTPYKMSIQTGGGVIYSTGWGTVGNLQNCLHVPELNENLISTGHVCKFDNSLSFVIELGVLKIRNRLEKDLSTSTRTLMTYARSVIYDGLVLNVIDDEYEAYMASDFDNSRRKYIRSLVHEVYVAQLEVAKR
jgi:hypothetical protein